MPETQILLALNITVQSIIEFNAIKILKYAIKDLSIYLAIKTNRSKKFIIGEWRISTFKPFLSDYSAFTLNPKKPPANLGSSTSIPAASTDVGTDPRFLGHSSSSEQESLSLQGMLTQNAELHCLKHWNISQCSFKFQTGNEQLRAVPLLVGGESQQRIYLALPQCREGAQS